MWKLISIKHFLLDCEELDYSISFSFLTVSFLSFPFCFVPIPLWLVSPLTDTVVSALRYVPKPGYGFAPTPRSYTFAVGVIFVFGIDPDMKADALFPCSITYESFFITRFLSFAT